MRKITKRSAAIATAAVLGVGGAGGAAAWAAGWFSGDGTTTAATEKALPISATITVKDALYPGATSAAGVTATNPNKYAVKVTGFTVVPDEFRGPDGCNYENSKIRFTKSPNFEVPANTNNASLADIDGLVTMGKDADVNCANAKNIRIKVTFTGEVA